MSSFRNALAVYLLWVVATWLLEGLPHTLLRPEAAALRLGYALVANLGIGILLPLWLIRRHLRAGWGTPAEYGFGGAARRWAAIAAGAAIGYGVFRASHPRPLDPIVLLNAFAQVWVVTAAEITVCWALAGATLRRALSGWTGMLGGAGLASLLFGVYHFVHSPPFNEPRMVAFLTLVGLATSLFWLVSRDLLGTAVFHNFFGVTGVLAALEAGGKLPALAEPAAGPVAMALLVAGALAIGARPAARS